MGFLFSEVLIWQLTRLSSRQSVQMDSKGRSSTRSNVGGRWSEEARAFVSQLAKAKARSGLRCSKGFCTISPGEATCSGV